MKLLLLAIAAVCLAALIGLGLAFSPVEDYCDGEYLMSDLEFVGDMNICMATPACSFGLDKVRQYRKSVKAIKMCHEKALIESIHDPDPRLTLD